MFIMVDKIGKQAQMSDVEPPIASLATLYLFPAGAQQQAPRQAALY
jgi:hypothetical protein